jgi:hypothetical protein
MALPPTRYLDAGPGTPQASPDTAAATAYAYARMGNTIAQVGEQGMALAGKLKQMDDGAAVVDLFAKMEKDASDFSIGLMTREDTANWPQEWQKRADTWRQEAKKQKLSPGAMAKFEEKFLDWNTRRSIQFETQAATKGIELARGKVANAYQFHMGNQNYEAAETALITAHESGILDSVALEKAKMEIATVREHNNTLADIQDDPIAYAKEHARPGPNEDMVEWQKYQNYADQLANRKRSDFYNDLIISGEMPPADELKQLEESGWIDKETHARIVTNQRNGPAVFDPALYEEAYTQVVEYDPTNDPSGRTEAQLRSWIASQALPKESISKLNEKLNSRLDPSTAGTPLAAHEKDFAAKMMTDFHRGDFGKYRFPVDSDNNPDTPPTFPINAAEYDKAHKVRGQFAEQWRAELKRLPADATFDQVQKSYDALKKSFKERTPSPTLNIGGSAPTQPFDPDKTYQSATPRANFGGQPVLAPGGVYQNAGASVFGGKDDPADSGKNYRGLATGPGGVEGAAVPQKLLAAMFPKNVAIVNGAIPSAQKDWVDANVRVVVRAPNGTMKVLPVADLGTAERIWAKNGRPVLDVTDTPAKELGGQIVYQNGVKVGLKGLDNLQFSVVSVDAGKPLTGLSWQDAKTAWFKHNKPGNMQAADLSLIALREAWNMANAAIDDDTAMVLPPKNSIQQ